MPIPTEADLKKDHPAAWDEMINIHKYEKFDFKGKQFLDLGAHLGFVSLLALCWGAKKIVAVEPEASNFELLQKNVAPYPEILPLRCAAHGYARSVSITDKSTHSKVIPSGAVPAIPLEELVSFFGPDDKDLVMKVDVEGAEFDLLLCAPASAIRRFSTIMIETHQTPHLKSHPARKDTFLKTYLDYLGYSILNEEPLCWIQDGKWTFVEGMTALRMRRGDMP